MKPGNVIKVPDPVSGEGDKCLCGHARHYHRRLVVNFAKFEFDYQKCCHGPFYGGDLSCGCQRFALKEVSDEPTRA